SATSASWRWLISWLSSWPPTRVSDPRSRSHLMLRAFGLTKMGHACVPGGALQTEILVPSKSVTDIAARRRFDEARAWADRYFDPESPVEEGWRRVLTLQRAVIEGKDVKVPETAELFDRDFPDLEQGDRLDLALKLAGMLRRAHRDDLARARIVAE